MTDSPPSRRQPPSAPRHPSGRTAQRPTPDKDQIALLEPFERLGLDRIALVSTPAQADQACDALASASAWGFDTESKPTFVQGETSDGPHIVQLATLERAWVFQLHDPGCRARVAELLAARGHDAKRVVVERNGEILPREHFSQTMLCEADNLEIVHFVGGG